MKMNGAIGGEASPLREGRRGLHAGKCATFFSAPCL